jgi:glucokinase
MEGAHMPAPLHLLNAKPYPCGCGRTWGCVEVYTTLSGLPHLLAERIGDSVAPSELKQRAFGLRGLAQKGDPLACEIFDFQARVLGLHVATLAMAVDPAFVVIGGGLMDPEATTEPFRERYLRIVRAAATRISGRAWADSVVPRGARRSVASHRRRPRRLYRPLMLA